MTTEKLVQRHAFTVVAVSRSQPATHTVHSWPTLTAIVRQPSSTPLVLSPEGGIEGHNSAIHDAQVYAYFTQHYDYWTARLGIDRASWDWAFWGENLTIRPSDHLDETTINLGDSWDFSSHGKEGVILEVCGGRNPCSRLAWRCGQPPAWLTQVAKSGFCGVYLKVLRGGIISPGDTANIVPTNYEDKVPVAAIAQCAFSPLEDSATRAMAERILRVPGLQNMNKQVIARKLSLIQDKESKDIGRWASWRALQVVKVVDESPLVKSFHLAATDDTPLASHLPGQFLAIKLPSGQIRCWSISSWTGSSAGSPPRSYRITVKKRSGASAYMHSRCSAGSILLARSPSGSFIPDWSREFPPRQIYISAGIGMTPILSMLQAHFSHTSLRQTPAILIHVARNSEQDVKLYLSEIVPSPLLRVIKFYTSPIAGVDVRGDHYDHEGRPTAEFFTTLMGPSYHTDPLHITPIELPGHLSSAYICGPSPFVDSMRGYLEAASVPPQAIRSENFSSDSSMLVDRMADVNGDVPEESLVKFSRKSTQAKWFKNDALSLLQLAEREALEPEYGCRSGDCGACEMRIAKGEARVLRSASREAREASGKPGTMIRSCCSIPASRILELEF